MFKSRKKKQQEILEKQQQEKDDYFNFDRIALFFTHEDHQDAQQVVDDRTLADLDFDELFMALDRTSSVVGQQYLYSILRVIPSNPKQAQRFEPYVNYFREHTQKKATTILELNRLNRREAYFLQRLFFHDPVKKPKWFWLIYVLSIALIGSLVVSIFYPKMLLAAMLFASVNIMFHFWNKNNILSYANVIPQLLTLHKVAAQLHKKEMFLDAQDRVNTSLQELGKLRRSAVFFKWDSESFGELSQAADYVLDLVAGALLIEPIIFFKLLGQISSKRTAIKILFEEVAQLDIAISLLTWRASLDYYCQPEYSNAATKTWESQSLYHPLIDKPESNDLDISDHKSILLSGSNMSGKTTYIRTVGINALLAQTINTACAQQLVLSPFSIYSAIQISDDLLDNTSYYYEEVKTIKQLVTESQSEQSNLFLLDELFKGTNTIERIASGKAVLSFLNGTTNLVFCSTHDLELIDYLQDDYEYYHFEESIQNGQLSFDYKLKKGSLNNTNAIRILEMNDFPPQITEDAKALVAEQLKVKSILRDQAQ